jgi:hypothetical protein
MSTACDHCLNAPYCEHRGVCELEVGCDDFVERALSLRDQLEEAR